MIIFNRNNFPEFSNFWPVSVTINEEQWQSTEHYYQAAKFTDEIIIQQFRNAKSPRKAKLLSRKQTKLLAIREDWLTIRVAIMEVAVMAKFSQHEDLKTMLLSTGQEEIVEGNENDSFWGIGSGNGQNMLGKILMRTREQLRSREFHNR